MHAFLYKRKNQWGLVNRPPCFVNKEALNLGLWLLSYHRKSLIARFKPDLEATTGNFGMAHALNNPSSNYLQTRVLFTLKHLCGMNLRVFRGRHL